MGRKTQNQPKGGLPKRTTNTRRKETRASSRNRDGGPAARRAKRHQSQLDAAKHNRELEAAGLLKPWKEAKKHRAEARAEQRSKHPVGGAS